MEAELIEGQVGNAGYGVSFKEGKLIIDGTYKAGAAEAGLVLKIDAGIVIDEIKKAIPGEIDDKILDGLKALLLK